MAADPVFHTRSAGGRHRTNLVPKIDILWLRNPSQVAENAAVLDLLSRGPSRLGVAIGLRDAKFDAYGIDKRERAPQTEESRGLVSLLLSEELVTPQGVLLCRGPPGHARTVQGLIPI